MEHERPTNQKGLEGALHRRVDHLKLSSETCDRILASAHPRVSQKAWYWPGLALAGAACLLIAAFGVVRLRTPPPAHLGAYIKSVSVVYDDNFHLNWSKRTVLVRKTNGTESYIKIVASKP